MDVVQHVYGNREQRNSQRERGGYGNRTGGLCGSYPSGHIPGLSDGYAAESECINTSYNYRGGYEQRSYHYLECARGHLIRGSLEQYAVERHGKRGRNVRLHTGSWDRTQSGNPDTFGHLHSDGHEDLFCGDSFCAAKG
jgi:hypothetical protein